MKSRTVGPLYDPKTLQAFLDRHGLGARKSLGQHFLISGPVVEAIVTSAEGCVGILEIGPGPGVLTQALAPLSERLIALELDARMLAVLAESAPNAEMRQADALKANLASMLDELPAPRALVSNMPYYITGPLLQRIAEVREHFDRAILMMQREVADRVVAPAGNSDRGSLSVYLQAQFEFRRLIEAPPSAFMPPPKVASTVLVLVPRAPQFDEDFFRLVRLGFTQPRKTLANNLANGLHRDRDGIVDLLESQGHSPTIRAHDLTEDDWLAMASFLAD